ncbi:L-lactate permease [Aerococcus sp. UMB8608]|uniref:L-lactate permease n=1 Tax=unclassified Aerococcus TaxID=2618060 RepID=UPI00254C4B23|nr:MULTISPECIES: L-lactate permease [unclassified Aerococcus]MDK6679524.1 L-lactate permease [Aerococcus sp. UMB8608]MDK6941010.1 L-lactate permease [Aerococcus sp. UMB8487]
MDHQLPLSILSWLVAILPMITLIITLVVLQWSAIRSAIISLIVGLVTAYFVFETPLYGLTVSLAQGAWDALEVVLVIWTALLFYQLCRHAGAFVAIKEGITAISHNYLYLILIFGWIFTSLLQGVTGFGAPMAIVAPILIGIGVKPAYAVLITLTSSSWSNLFGSLGVAWTTTLGLVQLENESLSLLYTSILLWIAALIGGLFTAWLYGKWQAIKEGLPAILIISTIYGGGQLLATQVEATIGVVLPGIIAMGAMVALAKWDRYKEASDHLDPSQSPIMQDNFDGGASDQENWGNLSLNQAFAPFYLLIALSIIMLGIPTISNWISSFEFSLLSYESFATGYQFVTEGSSAYSPFAPLTSPAVYLLASSLFAYLYYRAKGSYDHAENLGASLGQDVWADALTPTISTIGFLMVSKLLVNSGQNTVIALGIAAVSTPLIYAAIAPLIGIFSSFMTSSTTSGNILFIPIHQSVVQAMPQLSIHQLVASQSAGASVGNAIGPSNVVLGASTANAEEDTGLIYKWGIVFSLFVGLFMAIFAVIMYLYLAS